MQQTPALANIAQALEPWGLLTRGGITVNDDTLPDLPDGRRPQSLVLVGVAGSHFWPVFKRSPEFADGAPDPLDRWSERVGGEIASDMGAGCVFPFGGPPWLPFMRWAAQAEPTWVSPLGLGIHHDYGLWHAYRFALLFAETVRDELPPHNATSPCASCMTKPCLSGCPVGAFSDRGFDVERCYRYLAATPGAPCHSKGCVARSSCPVAPDYRYAPEHAAFHMAAFVAAQARRFGDN